jgi:putative hydrolase of the HAD superfamily
VSDTNSIKHVLFDLDETMYPKETGIMDLIGERINEYMSLRLGVDRTEVAAIRQLFYQQYGTTGRGLYLHYDLDLDEYFEFVHDLPVEDILEPDPELDEVLDGLGAEKSIFTNATARHASRILAALGVERHFPRIVDIVAMEYVPKPDIRSYKRALALLEARAEDCLLVDDRVRNLRPGQSLGMTTVLVGGGSTGDGADFVLQKVGDVGKVVEMIRSGRGGHPREGNRSKG